MQNHDDERLIEIATEIRNWVRAAAYGPVKDRLESVLTSAKQRAAYQMLDGRTSMGHVRIACRISPNALQALANSCTAMGLMEINRDKRRARLFDLTDFGLIGSSDQRALESDGE